MDVGRSARFDPAMDVHGTGCSVWDEVVNFVMFTSSYPFVAFWHQVSSTLSKLHWTRPCICAFVAHSLSITVGDLLIYWSHSQSVEHQHRLNQASYWHWCWCKQFIGLMIPSVAACARLLLSQWQLRGDVSVSGTFSPASSYNALGAIVTRAHITTDGKYVNISSALAKDRKWMS